ncbi:flavodoxin family protein [uncultured Corynebacterium sp.]|uniref:flavodoxin family protein n=1 Tax=uncultured Corynebacterium sp. TaxID=159447 RepID=UPI0025DFC8AE|nr:flavodoxin [uncultured Corynebacterium sp.]
MSATEERDPNARPQLLVVHHSPTPLLQGVFDAAMEGARHPDVEGVDVRVVEALDATADDVLAADAYLLGTSANFGYISGALKHFFDSTFTEVHAAAEAGEIPKGRPVSWWIRGGHDVTGAAKAMRSLTTGFEWEVAAEPVEFVGEVDDAAKERLLELGGTMAALLMGTEAGAGR